MKPEPALVRQRRAVLVTVRGDQRGDQVDAQRLVGLPARAAATTGGSPLIAQAFSRRPSRAGARHSTMGGWRWPSR
ncbi:MAG: hypothetical protein ACRDYA_01415 [Egibacteraceae bacterium]